MRFRLAAGLALVTAVFAVAPPARAQEDLALSVVSVDESAYPAIRAVVSVAAAGEAMPGLGPEAFAATLGDQPLAVTGVTQAADDSAGADITLVFDVSGSMAGAPIEQARAAAKNFVSALPPADRVAIIAFSDEVRTVLEYTSDRGAAVGAIDALTAGGNTALYQATADAAHWTAASTAKRRAAILLSDGLDFGYRSRVGRDESLTEAISAGVPFYGIGLGAEIDRGYLEYLAGATGGRFLEAPSPEDLEALYQDISAELQSQYILSLDATGIPLTQPTDLTVTLTHGTRTASDSVTLQPLAAPVDLDVRLVGVADGQEVRAGDVVSIVATPEDRIVGVTIRADGVTIGELRTPPFSFTMPELSEGPHGLLVEVRAADGTVANAGARIVTPPPQAAGGGLPLLPVAGVALAATVLGAVGYALLRWRASGPPPIEQRVKPWGDRVPTLDDWRTRPDEEQEPAAVTEPLGRLIALTGPEAGRAYDIGGRPVSAGSAPRCAIRLGSDETAAWEEARVWVRNGRLMVHRVATLTAMALEGATGGWAILEPGDDIELGGVRLRFELVGDAPERPAAPAPDAPPNADEALWRPAGEPADEPAAGPPSFRPVPAPPQAPADEPQDDAPADDDGPGPVSIFREGSRFAEPDPSPAGGPEREAPTDADAAPGAEEEHLDLGLDL